MRLEIFGGLGEQGRYLVAGIVSTQQGGPSGRGDTLRLADTEAAGVS